MRHWLSILGAALTSLPAAAVTPAQEVASVADTAHHGLRGAPPLSLEGALDAEPLGLQGMGQETRHESLDFPALLELLRTGEIELERAFPAALGMSARGDVAATEWCLELFDIARRERGMTGPRGDLPYSAAEASAKQALYTRWIEAWPGSFTERDFNPLPMLDLEARAIEPVLGRETALGLLEQMQLRSVAPRARASVLLARANILARSPDSTHVELARSIYRRVQRRFAGTPAGRSATRAIWRSEHLARGMVAPDFETHDFAGNEIRLSDFRGQIVVVHFWQQTSDRREHEDRSLDALRELARRYWDTPFALIGVNGDGDVDHHRVRWVEHGVVWHEAFEPSHKEGARAAWRVDEWPSTFVLDATGVVRAYGLSALELQQTLEPLVARRAAEVQGAVSAEPPSNQ